MHINTPLPKELPESPKQDDAFFSIKNLGGFILLILVVGALVVFTNRSEKSPDGEVATKPENCLPLAQGEQIYNILTDNQQNPQIKQATFDPLDVKMGETQTITVKVLNSGADTITSDNKTSVIFHTDNKSTPVSLLMKRVDNVNNSIDFDPEGVDLLTTWEGGWVNNDTYCTSYTASISAASILGESNVDISFR